MPINFKVPTVCKNVVGSFSFDEIDVDGFHFNSTEKMPNTTIKIIEQGCHRLSIRLANIPRGTRKLFISGSSRIGFNFYCTPSN